MKKLLIIPVVAIFFSLFMICSAQTIAPSNIDVSDKVGSHNYIMYDYCGTMTYLMVSDGIFTATPGTSQAYMKCSQSWHNYYYDNGWVDNGTFNSTDDLGAMTAIVMRYSNKNILYNDGSIFFKPPLSLVTAVKAVHPEQVLGGIIAILAGGCLILMISLIAFRRGWQFLLRQLGTA